MGARVYSYIRFSDARQAAGHSSERQGEFAARWAAQHGLQLDDQLTMRDEGLSAYHQRHITPTARLKSLQIQHLLQKHQRRSTH